MKVSKKSMLTGEIHTMNLDVTYDEYYAWQNGMLIQDACPRLNADEREFLMTGITPDEWNNMFEEDE